MRGSSLSKRPGVVLWSRVRLCRNLAGHRFISSEKTGDSKSESGQIQSAETCRETYEKIADAVGAVATRRPLRLKSLSDISEWEIIELLERGLLSEYLRRKKQDDYRGIISAPEGSVPAMVNERYHLVLQDLRPGFQLKRAWSEVDALDDLFSAELKFAWDRKFGFLFSDSERCGTGLDVMVNVHLPGLILLNEISQVVAAFNAVGLALDAEIYDDAFVGGFGQLLRVTNNMTVARSEDAVLSKMEKAVADLVLQERQARSRILKDSSLKLRMYDKIARALAALRNSLLLNRSDTFEFISWLRVGAALGVVEGMTLEQVDRLHQELWASNFPPRLGCSYDAAVEHVNVARTAVLRKRLDGVELAF